MNGPRKRTIAEILLEIEPRESSTAEIAELKKQTQEKIELIRSTVDSHEFKAWAKIERALARLNSDPEIKKSKTCTDFLGLVERLMPLVGHPKDIEKIIAPLGKHFESQIRKRAAGVRHDKSKPAKEFVQREWVAHREAYAGNKTAFADHYVRRVWNEFQVKVSTKQIREVWLKDTPHA